MAKRKIEADPGPWSLFEDDVRLGKDMNAENDGSSAFYFNDIKPYKVVSMI